MRKSITMLVFLNAAVSLADAPVTGVANIISDAQGVSKVIINGDAAKELYDNLDVPVQSTFGIVQAQEKVGSNIVCRQSILGDVRGRMSSPFYSCTIVVDKTGKAMLAQ